MLTILYSQTRTTFAMCRDGLLPEGLARLIRRRTPWLSTLIFACSRRASPPSSRCPRWSTSETLFAFVLVNIGVIRLRRSRPDLERPFRAPLVRRRRYPKSRRPVRLAARSARVSW